MSTRCEHGYKVNKLQLIFMASIETYVLIATDGKDTKLFLFLNVNPFLPLLRKLIILHSHSTLRSIN